jgi:hypothetical protein
MKDQIGAQTSAGLRGWSVWLRHPHGFEGLGSARIHLYSHGPSIVSKSPNLREAGARDVGSAPRTAPTNGSEDDDVIASVDYLLELDAEVIKGSTPGFPETNDALGSTIRLVRRAVGELKGNPPLDVRVKAFCGSGEVSPVERFVTSANPVDSFPGHRPRSIPQSQESA